MRKIKLARPIQSSPRPSSWNKRDLLLSAVERYRKGKGGQGGEGRGGERRGRVPRPPVHPFASVEIKSWLRP